MKKQEIFNAAVKGLASQGFKQAKTGLGCAYRTVKGSRCAIGHLIKDRFYKPDLEGKTPEEPDVFDAVYNSCGSLEDVSWGFLAELQECHDHAQTPAVMRAHLRDFAEENNLTLPKELQ